jgi:hypothetical protein
MKSFISVESPASVPKTGTKFQDQMRQKMAYQMQFGDGIDLQWDLVQYSLCVAPYQAYQM